MYNKGYSSPSILYYFNSFRNKLDKLCDNLIVLESYLYFCFRLIIKG